ncbi:MAG: hypothetical protein ACTHNS_14830, partial [Marmoricola sp.]
MSRTAPARRARCERQTKESKVVGAGEPPRPGRPHRAPRGGLVDPQGGAVGPHPRRDPTAP